MVWEDGIDGDGGDGGEGRSRDGERRLQRGMGIGLGRIYGELGWE